ncbi:tetratricopeptide (TPR) repeat protein [Saccharothrix coeruleofusca]|uniref:helix-turn-helix domain-containing protein n=1 Tax=Saccharothrix coeruleofusca TaxID=33919 RepID=UPI001AE991B2|nr:helix-turn-helix transcriptional regulator [Saccharothrix coeruleofusca]MBP2338748.1 tetratricopeptide (TPR) repeat protein [Saccharothrix coeruleofusca]
MREPTSIGELLRRLRAGAGRSQSEQADVLSERAGRAVTRNEVSRWETEKRMLTPYWQQHYADSFGIPVGIVKRAVAAAKARRRLEQREHHGGDDVQRREFLGAMAGLAVTLPGVARSEVGSRLGVGDVRMMLMRSARLRRLDDYLGGADTVHLYATELAATTKLVREASCTTAVRKACTAVIAEQAQLAGWAAFDAGMHDVAKQHYTTSFAAAKEAEDAALAGNALAFLAYQQVTVDKPNVETATASYAIAERQATPKVRALLLERMAWTHAVAGQADAADRALAEAAEVVHQRDERPEPDWVFWVDEDEIKIMAGRCWTQLRRPLRAVPVLEDVLSRYGDTHARDKAMYLTSLAHAYLDAGEVEQAATITERAARLASGVGSVRPAEKIQKLVRRLKPHRSLPMVFSAIETAGLLATAQV